MLQIEDFIIWTEQRFGLEGEESRKKLQKFGKMKTEEKDWREICVISVWAVPNLMQRHRFLEFTQEKNTEVLQ